MRIGGYVVHFKQMRLWVGFTVSLFARFFKSMWLGWLLVASTLYSVIFFVIMGGHPALIWILLFLFSIALTVTFAAFAWNFQRLVIEHDDAWITVLKEISKDVQNDISAGENDG